MTSLLHDPAQTPGGVRGSPFVGLAPYGEEDADFFFGRERERRLIIANLRSARLTLLYGESGVGKSSILRAGVMHDLRTRMRAGAAGGAMGGKVPLCIASFSEWREGEPVQRLMRCVHASVSEALGPDAAPAEPPGREPIAALRAWTDRVRSILIVFDQFEEYFLYHAGDDGAGSFAEFFPRVVNDAALNVHVLIAIREDAWARLDRFKSSVPGLFANYLRLGHLGEEAARRAIVRPIEVYNERAGTEYTIEPELVDAVIEGAGRQSRTPPGGDMPPATDRYIETPLLQLVMDRLWDATPADGDQTLRRAALEALGGPRAIVRSHFTSALAGLDVDQQAVAAAVSRFLVTSDKSKVAQRASDLAEWTSRPEAEVIEVLERLTRGRSGRILRPLGAAPGEQSPRYELAHDVLGEPIVMWRRAYESRRAAEEAAERERQAERDALAARHNRLVRRAAMVLAALVLALAVAAVLALDQRSAAVEEESIARSTQLAAAATAQLENDPELSVLLAREAWATAETEDAEAALRTAVSASLIRRPSIDHGEPIAGTRTSADGRVLATWGARRLATWRSSDGRRLSRRRLEGIQAVALARDGRRVAVTDAQGAAVYPARGRGRRVVLAGARTADELPAVAFSPDGTLVAAAGSGGATVWRTATGAREDRLVMNSARAVAFHPRDSRLLAVAGDDGDVRLWRRAGGPVRVVRARGARVAHEDASATVVEFSPDGRFLATAVRADAAQTWEVGTGRLRRTFRGIQEPIDDIEWSPDGTVLLAATGRLVQGFAEESGVLRFALGGHGARVGAVRMSRDGTFIATVSDDGTAQVFDGWSAGRTAVLRPHGAAPTGVDFAARRVVTSSRDGRVRLWDPVGSRELIGRVPRVVRATFADDGRLVIAAGARGGAFAFDRVDDTVLRLRAPAMRRIRSLDVSEQGSVVAMAGAGRRAGAGRVVYSELADGSPRATVPLPGAGELTLIRIAPDGKHVLLSAAGTASLSAEGEPPATWLAKTSTETARVLQVDGYAVRGGAFSADGRRVVVAADDGRARIYNTDGSLVRALPPHGPQLLGAAFDPRGRRVLTYGGLGSVRIVDAADGTLIRALRGSTSPVTSAAFSRDGRRVVASAGRTIRIWDAGTGALLGVLEPHADVITSVEFTRDGGSVLSGGDDGSVYVTRCETCGSMAEVLALAERRVTRTLTDDERAEFNVASRAG